MRPDVRIVSIGVASGLVLLSALPLGQAVDPLAAPAWAGGDRAVYSGSGPAEFAIRDAMLVIGRDGLPVDVFEVAVELEGAEYREFVGARSGTIEVAIHDCPVRIGSGCLPLRLHTWETQGAPAVLGASILQGRSFMFGDSWVQSAECGVCVSPLVVRVQAPTDDSPTGTVYVAEIEVTYDFYAMPAGRLHMSAEHSYPLRADLNGGTYVLESFTRGGGEAMATPIGERSFEFSLTTEAFEDGRPREGTPLAGHVSWEQTRAMAGVSTVGGEFRSLDYSSRSRSAQTPITGTVVTEQEWTWVEEYAYGEENGTNVRISRTRTLPQLGIDALDRTAVEESTGQGAVLGACTHALVPLWDLVEFATSTSFLHGLTGYLLRSDCERFAFTARGDSVPGATETVTLDGSTGALRHALTIVESE